MRFKEYIMRTHDPALVFSNPRILSAVYFGLLSVVGTILIDGFLTLLGFEEIVPLFKAILLGMVISSTMGAIFGKNIIHCPKPYKIKTFCMGFIMVIVSLPVFDLGLVYFMDQQNSHLFAIAQFQDIAYTYVVVLAYSYVIFGFLLAIGAGLAAMYLRGQLVYDILHTDKRRSQVLPNFVMARNKAKPVRKTTHLHRKKT